MKHLLMAALVATAFTPSAQAWSKAGHMATGAIAYRVLKKENPATIPKVIAILKKNPYYEESWKQLVEKLDAEADADEFLFMQAARWADDARGDPRFYPDDKYSEFVHYINQPFKPAGQPNTVLTKEPREINIVREFPRFLEDFKTAKDERKRAIALCWVMHLVGDSHQPLHTVSLYTEKFQFMDQGRMVGDRGGTWFYVRVGDNPKGVNLHQMWDGMVTEKEKYRENRNAVIQLMQDPEHALEKLAEEAKVLDIEKWVKESYDLAVSKAYFFNGQLLKGGTKLPEAEPLPAGYPPAVEPIAKRRGVLAGYRMAGVLGKALGD